jgi:hypothetical protein
MYCIQEVLILFCSFKISSHRVKFRKNLASPVPSNQRWHSEQYHSMPILAFYSTVVGSLFIYIHNSNCFDLVSVLDKMKNQLSQIHQLGVSLSDSFNETRYPKDFQLQPNMINSYKE